MSSLAYPREHARRKTTPAVLPAFLSQRGSDVLLASAVLAIGTTLLAILPGCFSVDSWLALTAGRDVWNLGIPHLETLTAMSHGVAWVDQQWLSEFVTYGLYLLGGLALVGVVNVGLLALGIGGAVAAARRLGAQPKSILIALPLCVWLILPSREVRTQEFAIPLFTAVAYLLARDSRNPSRRVYWCLPILTLWGNVHGTATIGALLVVLRGGTVIWERRAALRSPQAWKRPLALILGAPLFTLLTPYGTQMLSYYQTMYLHSSVRHAVTEWQPITFSWWIAVPFFIAAALLLWSFGRNASATTLWERLALIVLAAGSIEVIRNVLFFGLCALMLMPLSLDLATGRTRTATSPRDGRRARINGLVLLAAGLSAVIGIAATFARPASSLELGYQRLPLLAAVEKATSAQPSLKVLTDVRFADWLLWRDPALRGRVANDARFELLSTAQLTDMQRVFAAIGTNWQAGATGYGLIVVDRKYDPYAASGFVHEAGARVLYDDGQRLVILRAQREAG